MSRLFGMNGKGKGKLQSNGFFSLATGGKENASLPLDQEQKRRKEGRTAGQGCTLFLKALIRGEGKPVLHRPKRTTTINTGVQERGKKGSFRSKVGVSAISSKLLGPSKEEACFRVKSTLPSVKRTRLLLSF